VSAFYYAILHFLKSKTLVAYADISAFTGFQLALEALGNLFNPQIFDALPALFVVGVFLALIRCQIPNSLGLCIGCHCGWVWQIKLCKDLFNVNPHADYLYLVSSYDGVIGPLIAVWLSVALIIFYLVQRTRSLPSY